MILVLFCGANLECVSKIYVQYNKPWDWVQFASELLYTKSETHVHNLDVLNLNTYSMVWV